MIFLLFLPTIKIMSPFLHSFSVYKGLTRQELLFSSFFLLASSLLWGEFFHIQVGKDIVTTLKLPPSILTVCITFSLLPHWHIALLSWHYLIYSALTAVEANTRKMPTLWCYFKAPAPAQLKIYWLSHCFMVACVTVKVQSKPKRKETSWEIEYQISSRTSLQSVWTLLTGPPLCDS